MKVVFIILILTSQLAMSGLENPAATCLKINKQAGPYGEWGFPQDTLTEGDKAIMSPDDELRQIYSLLSYAVVYKNWQQEKLSKNHNGKQYTQKFASKSEVRSKKLDAMHGKHSRGHNFGAILVNSSNEVVHWARNNNHALCNETQHGEVRVIQQYLQKSKLSNLSGHTIYVTGDSCPMCAGMISQQKISTAVLGLSNPFFGKNFDRMNLNSRACGDDFVNGTLPVSRQVNPVMSGSEVRRLLDKQYRKQIILACAEEGVNGCSKKPNQTKFLKSEKAHELFEMATRQFYNYKLSFPNSKAKQSKKTNRELYKDAVSFLQNKVSSQVSLPSFHKKNIPTSVTCKQGIL